MEYTKKDFVNEEEFNKCIFPFIFERNYPILGWDIPNYFRIDSNLNIFLDNSGHGVGLHKIELSQALINCDLDFGDINYIYNFLKNKNYNFTNEDVKYFFKKLPLIQNELISNYNLKIKEINCSCCNGTGKVKKLKGE